MGKKIEVGDEDKQTKEKEAIKMCVQVGKNAPDFQAPAFHEGQIKQIKLSDYSAKWVLLCFYPGDFTFV